MRKRMIIILWLSVLFLCVDAGERRVGNGQTVAEVIDILGEPNGKISVGEKTSLIYAGVLIDVPGGVVSDLPRGFNERVRTAQKEKKAEAIFVRGKKEKGLVLYQNEWMTPDEKKVAGRKESERRHFAAAKKKRDAEVERIKSNRLWSRRRNRPVFGEE